MGNLSQVPFVGNDTLIFLVDKEGRNYFRSITLKLWILLCHFVEKGHVISHTDKLKNYVEFIRYNNVNIIKNVKKQCNERSYSVVELTRHTPIMLIQNCVKSLKIDEIMNDDQSKIMLQNTTLQVFNDINLNESVSEIMG